MTIETNNGRTLDITESRFGITVTAKSSTGEVDYKRRIDEADIISLLNLVEYMRENDYKSVYLMNDETRRYCRNLIGNGDIDEFPVLQY